MPYAVVVGLIRWQCVYLLTTENPHNKLASQIVIIIWPTGFKGKEGEGKMAFIIFLLIFAVSALRCSSGFDRHRQDWVDNSCPDEVPRHNLREWVQWKAYCNLSVCWEAASFSIQGEPRKPAFTLLFFLFEWLRTAVTAFLVFQTKDKLCDIIDTTYLYPFTTTVVAKTTSRSQEATAGQGTPSTSHSPTSIPTEGKIKQNSDLERAQSFSVKYFCQDAKWSGAFAGTVLYWYWRVCSFATSTRHFSLLWKRQKHGLLPPT